MTLVLDASVVAEYLVDSEIGVSASERMVAGDGELHVPHLAIVETTSVLRAWVQRGEVTEQRAVAALADLADLPAQRWPGEALLDRIWELRHRTTAYDAAYVALAELIDAELLTTDGRLARAVEGIAVCPVIVID